MNRELLRRRLESCNCWSYSLDEVVDLLRSTYRDYQRIKKQPFTTFVRKTLKSLSQESPSPQQLNKRKKRQVKLPSPSTPGRTEEEYDDEGEEEVEGSRTSASRTKKRRMLSGKHHQTSDDPSEEELESSSDGGDGFVSTLEDAVYGEKMEPPQFDVTKSSLLAAYKELSGAAVKRPEKTAVEENVELEVDSKKANKIELVDGGRGRPGRVGTELPTGRDGGVEVVKGEEGPRFRDLGGMDGVLEELKMEVMVPLYHPQLPRWLGVQPMAGILLHGPPGCGKTKLAHAIANETGVPFYKISATEIVSGVSGASEENIRVLFSKAYRTAPSIVFIDEIDAIASKRENLHREMERRIVTQLMTCMDESHRLVHPSDANSNSGNSDQRPGYVLVIGATNRPDAVDSALRRPGRFDREIVLGVPDENGRAGILSVITRNLRLEGSFDRLKIARSTPGFVGADLAALVNKAGNLAMKRIIDERKSLLSKDSINEEYTEDWWRQPWLPEEMEKLTITMADFEGLHVDLETGFLLYGPPGCGKTLIAKAVANEAGANFIHIKGPELLNKYVGESELAVRTLFSRARTCSPCVLFFDEVDALTTNRGKEGGWVVERLVNQLLIELDGAEQRRGVFVIGATNRPEAMDLALLRPGRFGKLLYVPLPNANERGLILKALGRKKPIDASVDLGAIGRMDACENLSGADLAALMNEAVMVAVEERLSTESISDATSWTIKATHFERALSKISPSVSDKQKQYYKILSETLKAA
ncbi:cell division control protein 48 homolog C isoform X4 [Carya illinoinensis]|uniref:cell division control protein 48 homolog C isoform X4 n=1 Tax=Carya illinoinensis TaxID=32201 RepID=UPI001C71A8B6|nr:cell division control protein 48 homolog C isoform X4 [Carya illinoinensis]